MSVAPATPEQLDDVWALADAEFMHGRGRTGSVVDRFAGLATGGAEPVVATDDGQVVAAAVWRPFAYDEGDRSRRAAMVGLVVTHPAHRGRGLGSAVLTEVRRRMVAADAEVAVLWAGRHDVYTRLGWRPGDPGVRAMTHGDPDGDVPAAIATWTPAVRVAQELLAIHRRQGRRGVERNPATYASVPPQGDRVTAHVVAGEAYVLVAARGEQRYVLEFAGAPQHLPVLWDAVRAGRGSVVVNEERGSAAERYLAEAHGLRFDAQNLALWLPLDPALRRASLTTWHIPWIDRI